jgi:hypothetical protein
MSFEIESSLESLLALSASLSPAPPDLEELHANEIESKQKLSIYIPRSSSDDTVKVLNAFIENLPFDGKRIIVKFIAVCEDHNLLYELATHLTSAVLIPSIVLSYAMFLFSCLLYCD